MSNFREWEIWYKQALQSKSTSFMLMSCIGNEFDFTVNQAESFESYYSRLNCWPKPLLGMESSCLGFCMLHHRRYPVLVYFIWRGGNSVNENFLPSLQGPYCFELKHSVQLTQSSLHNVARPVEIGNDVLQTIEQIATEKVPLNYMICRFDLTTNALQLIDTGMAGLCALEGLGGVHCVLEEYTGQRLYIYFRVEVPLNKQHADITVPKFVLVEWIGDVCKILASEKIASNFECHAISKKFPHHVKLTTMDTSKLKSDVLLDMVHHANDDQMFVLQIVYIGKRRELSRPLCLNLFQESTVGDLKECIASKLGIPIHEQHLVWLYTHRNNSFDDSVSTKAVELNSDCKFLQEDIGLASGGRLYLDEIGKSTALHDVIKKVNSGNLKVSLERRHSVHQGIQHRERLYQQDIESTEKLLEQAMLSSDASTNLEKQLHQLQHESRYLDIPRSEITILSGKKNELGLGKAATVYHGIWHHNGGSIDVALKIFRYSRLTESIMRTFIEEVALLRKLHHPNIVLLIGACTSPSLTILTEFCLHRSLYHTLQTTTMSFHVKARMMLDAAKGLSYLHSNHIIHRDVKSHNFLVDENYTLKVGDFGISKFLSSTESTYTQCGTSGWAAPEVLAESPTGYQFTADNWSFAIVLWEMVAEGHSNPFLGLSNFEFYQKAIQQHLRPPIPPHVPESYASLITANWHSTPSQRPTFAHNISILHQIVSSI